MSRILSTSRALNTDPTLLIRLRDAGHDVQVLDRPGLSEQDMAELAARCSALVVGVEPVTAAVIDAAPDLRIVARPGVGHEMVDVDYASRSGVWVTITPGANADSVADHTLALILASLRHVGELQAAVTAGGWPRSIGVELRDLVLGLVGLGAIGRGVAERARAFGMRVVAHDPFPDRDHAARYDISLVTFEALLADSDVISLHAPLTDETHGMFDRTSLERCKRGALLVNTARGGLVVEEDLADAVESGQVGCAALDVLATEPPTNSPLIGRDRILITPHVAAYTRQALNRMAAMAVDSVIEALAGREPGGLLNPHARTITTEKG